VIVDAASELPPKNQLSRYVKKGADLVVFSGGKYLGGPNNSGILTGRKDLIKLAHLQAYPFHGIGRTAKMSRETIVGLVKALELYMEKDEEEIFIQWEKRANWFAEQLSELKGVETGVTYQRTVPEGEPMVPLCYLKLKEDVCGVNGRDLVNKLREGDPCIELLYESAFLLEDYKDKVTINPEFMQDGDELIVIKNIKKLLNRP
jgi:seryl-tRNA(Sec) selenium transferase